MGGCDDHQRFFASLVKRKRREWAILTSRKKKTGLICWEFLFDKQKAEFWADGGVVIIIVVVIVLIVVAVVIVATVAVVVVAVVLIVVGCNLFALSLEKWLLTYSVVGGELRFAGMESASDEIIILPQKIRFGFLRWLIGSVVATVASDSEARRFKSCSKTRISF